MNADTERNKGPVDADEPSCFASPSSSDSSRFSMDRKCIQRDLCILETQHNTWLPHQLESISSSSMRCFDLTGNRSTARVTDQLTLHRNCSSGEREGERGREEKRGWSRVHCSLLIQSNDEMDVSVFCYSFTRAFLCASLPLFSRDHFTSRHHCYH